MSHLKPNLLNFFYPSLIKETTIMNFSLEDKFCFTETKWKCRTTLREELDTAVVMV